MVARERQSIVARLFDYLETRARFPFEFQPIVTFALSMSDLASSSKLTTPARKYYLPRLAASGL
jgi:hypothetical protein